ncbi:MAG: hypothetical protein ACO27F_04400 [Beijerinckiaceae bacterium]|jgi:hypothetical protein
MSKQIRNMIARREPARREALRRHAMRRLARVDGLWRAPQPTIEAWALSALGSAVAFVLWIVLR